MTRISFLSLAFLATLHSSLLCAQAATPVEIFWDFDNETPTINGSATFSVSAMTEKSGGVVTRNATSGQVSGNTNAGIIATTGGSDETQYSFFRWSITPDDVQRLTVTNFNFRSRSTGTGPTSWKLVAENSSTNLVIGSGTGMPTTTPLSWNSYDSALVNLSALVQPSDPLIFTLYGYGGSGNPSSSINWRIDDVCIYLEQEAAEAPLVIVPPVLSVSDISYASATLSWPPVSHATGYAVDVYSLAQGAELASCAGTNTNAVALNGWNTEGYIIVSGSPSISLVLMTNSVLTSPSIDITTQTGALFSFNARTYNSGQAIHIEISTDGGVVWELVDTFTPANNVVANNRAELNLTPWVGHNILLRLTVPNAAGNNSSGVANLSVHGATRNFVAGYNNRVITGATTCPISGLYAGVRYYALARSKFDAVTSQNSATISFTTLTTLPTVVALAATDVTHDAFTANWEPLAGAMTYQVDVFHGEPRVIISQYVEGSSNNKAIEISNIGGMPADLSDYSLMLQSNGVGAFGSELSLSGILAPGASYLVAHTSANATLANLINSSSGGGMLNGGVTGFNGNDAVGLFYKNALYDCVGLTNNAALWGDEMTLTRKPTISQGRATYDAGEWLQTGQDDFAGLGSHTADSTRLPTVFNVAGSASSFRVTGLKPEREYAYRVRGVASPYIGPNSALIPVTTATAPKTTVIVVR